MGAGIIVPLVVLPIVIIVGFVWYRRTIARMKPTAPSSVSGVRLTAEAFHRLDSPPWRVVYEVSAALGGVDHVLIGPPGVIAITTVVADRPDSRRLVETRGEAQLMSEAAIARGPIDELLRAVQMSSQLSASVFWGTPAPGRAPFDHPAYGNQLVEGQRIAEWLATLEQTDRALLDQGDIDRAWQTILVGIGRPDPLV